MAGNLHEESNSIRTRVGRVGSIDLYEIKDSELDELERGGPADLQLNFGLVLITLALSVAMMFSSASVANKTLETFYMILGVVAGIVGVLLLFMWNQTRRATKTLCSKIRGRIATNAVADDKAEAAAATDDIGEAPLKG